MNLHEKGKIYHEKGKIYKFHRRYSINIQSKNKNHLKTRIMQFNGTNCVKHPIKWMINSVYVPLFTQRIMSPLQKILSVLL